jgi:ATP-binding cassette subfamily B (MDR/TAP) protein 1
MKQPQDKLRDPAKDKDVKTASRASSSKKEVIRRAKFSELMSFLDTSKSKYIFGLGLISATLNGCVLPVLAYVFSASFANMASLSFSRIKQTVLIYIGIGIFACIVSCLQNISFDYVSKKACINFRLKWFSALLRQDAAFFDVTDMSGLASSMEPNAQAVKRGLGKKFGEGVQFTVTTLGGIGLALYMSWRVALTVLSVVPFVSASAIIVMRINQRQTESQNKAYTEAGSVVYQTVSCIRTVFALNAAPRMIQMYQKATEYAYNTAFRPLIKVGFANGEL